MGDGWTADKVFDTLRNGALTYDDIILMPGYINFGVEAVDFKSRITRNIEINTPIISAPMDTVTESDMAISLALLGGLGIIHCNMEIEDQK